MSFLINSSFEPFGFWSVLYTVFRNTVDRRIFTETTVNRPAKRAIVGFEKLRWKTLHSLKSDFHTKL